MIAYIILAALVVSLCGNLLLYRTWRKAYEDGRAMGYQEGKYDGIKETQKKFSDALRRAAGTDRDLINGVRNNGRPSKWTRPPEPIGGSGHITDVHG